MKKADLLQLPSMPAAGPSYPAGPYRFINREYMVITYETDPAEIADQLPEPLEPLDRPLVHYEGGVLRIMGVLDAVGETAGRPLPLSRPQHPGLTDNTDGPKPSA